MKLHVFLISLILVCATTTTLYGHEIHLTDGKIIQTNNAWKVGNKVKYEKYGGTISIAASQVKEIVYSKSRKRTPKSSEQNDSTTSDKNLAAILTTKLNPKTPVEEASISTVSVKTATGFGSGFFISDNGFIITNKHVVRGSEQQNNGVDEKFDLTRKNLREYKKYLNQVQKKISEYKADLKKNQPLLKEMKKQAQTDADKQYVASRQEELNDFKKFIREQEKKYKKDKKEYQSRKKEFDKQLKQFQGGQQKLARQNSFEVILADGTKLYADLYKVSNQHDLALLKLSGYKTPFLTPVLRDDLSQGQAVFAVGSPISLNLNNTVTSGVLSGFRDNFIQTNAQIYPGNSGGPLIDEQGQVIGINTKKLVTRKFEGLGFAIPIRIAFAEFRNHIQMQ